MKEPDRYAFMLGGFNGGYEVAVSCDQYRVCDLSFATEQRKVQS